MLAAVLLQIPPLFVHEAVPLDRMPISLSEDVHRREERGDLDPLVEGESVESGGRAHVRLRRDRLGCVDRSLAGIVPEELQGGGRWVSSHFVNISA